MKPIIMIFAAMLLAGCQTTHPPISADGFCALGLFYPDEGAIERWTNSEKAELVTRNEVAEKLCGVKS